MYSIVSVIILAKQKYKVPKIQSTELKKFNKQKCPSEDTWEHKESNHKLGGREGTGRRVNGK